MKNPRNVRRDWTLVLIIVPVGVLLMWLVGQLAIRLAPTWAYAADMRSHLNLDSSYINPQDNGDVAPVLPEILTPAYWEGTYLTPGATYPTRENVPTLQPTYTATPTATATDIPAAPTLTSTPTILYPTLTFTPTATPITYTLMVYTTGNGSVDKTPNLQSYPAGSNVRLTANPSPGWTFAGWTGDLSGSANPITITMNGNKTVRAIFTRNEYTLTVNIVGNGTVIRNPNQATYYHNDPVELTATPNPGWVFAGWSGDLNGSANPASILMNANKTVTATFTQIEYSLTINTVGNGTVTKNPNQATYHYGDTVQLTANPDPGWAFSGWSADLGGSANPASITIDGAKTVTATFTQAQYTLTINIVGSGSVTKNPDQATYPAGASVMLTANPNPGWPFSSWSGDLSGSTNPQSILMDGNKTVTATFTAIEYTLTINISGNGTVTKNPDQTTYHYGDVVQLTANAGLGWAFSGWSGDLGGSTNPGSLTILGNRTVTATFINPEPDIGAPDGYPYSLTDGISGVRVFDLGGYIEVTGDPNDLGRYDLVYYEMRVPLTSEIFMDWVILQISTDGTSWYTIFYWGDGNPDLNSNVAGYLPETDNLPIPLSALYGSLPYQTGIEIDVDGALGVAVPGELADTVPGPVPNGSYRYLRIYSPLGGADNGLQFDSLQILP